MALAKRSEDARNGNPLSQPAMGDNSYEAGGPVAQMQADLARRFLSGDVGEQSEVTSSPAERIVRFVSVSSGYLALAAAYAGVAALLMR